MTEPLELDLLRSLVAAIDAESVTAAAARLGVTQPTISKHIAALEARYGARLLHRDGRGVRATGVSRRLCARARAILERADALAGLGEAPAAERVVRVALPPTVAHQAAAPLVSAVQARDPGLRLSVTEGFSDHVADWVRQGAAQAGVVYTVRDLHGLAVTAAFNDVVHFVLPAGMGAGGHGAIERAALERMDFALPARPHGMRLLVDSMAAQFGLRLRVTYEMASLGTIRQLVQSGRAASVLPFSAVAEDVQAGRMRVGQAESGPMVRSLAVVSAAARTRLADEQAVMDDLCAVLEREMTYATQELRRLGGEVLRVRFD